MKCSIFGEEKNADWKSELKMTIECSPDSHFTRFRSDRIRLKLRAYAASTHFYLEQISIRTSSSHQMSKLCMEIQRLFGIGNKVQNIKWSVKYLICERWKIKKRLHKFSFSDIHMCVYQTAWRVFNMCMCVRECIPGRRHKSVLVSSIYHGLITMAKMKRILPSIVACTSMQSKAFVMERD